ncbi:DUF2726 domain-containing protein [Moraxella oblonga]|uniref:DUF2726 domain-containing protein n=1 Tax=Moraxella oblonga TaxID=200413 RepID=UPI0008367E9E|nr:DUF2726 domain-containing protein [Moraxella oblonga]
MWWFVGVVVIIVVGVILTKTRQEAVDSTPPPVKGDELAIWPFTVMPIMTDSEVIFFKKLVEALPEYLIFSQVQLSRIIEPSEDAGNDRAFWFNRICRQSVDYVVVAKDCQTVLLAIELDDWTHESKTRQKQDDKKDKALASAGIAVVRFHAERMPSIQMIRHDVLMVLQDL